MKHTRKISIALIIMMVLMMTLAVIPASAKNMTGGEKLYLVPNSNWNQSNARFAAYFFGSAGDAWVSMTKVDGETNLYEVTVPTGNWTNVIFCRMNPGAAANNWNNKWNQTSDLVFDGTNNRYTVKAGTWDKGGGTWDTYVVDTSCQHTNTVNVPQVDPTCATPGTAAGVKCANAECGAPISGFEAIPATGVHTFNGDFCSVCGAFNLENSVTIYFENNWKWTDLHVYYWIDGGKDNTWPGTPIDSKPVAKSAQGHDIYAIKVPVVADHVIINGTKNDGSGATDQTPDITHGDCAYYSMLWDGTKNTVETKAYHNLTHVEAVDANCYENGNTEYWYCDVCECVWADEDLTQQTNLKNVVVPMAHAPATHVEAVEPGCENGNIEYWYCEACGQAWLDEACTLNTNLKAVILPGAGGHVYDDNCDSDCNVCEEWRFDAPHNLTYVPGVVPTSCQETGYDEYWECADCGAYFGDEEANQQLNPAWMYYSGEHVRPEDAIPCAVVACVVCGEDSYGEACTRPEDAPVCQDAACIYCNEIIWGWGCNYNTGDEEVPAPLCQPGNCAYCGTHYDKLYDCENGAWAPCSYDGECAYGCGKQYPATGIHAVDNPCEGGLCWMCWNEVEPQHEYLNPCDAHCMVCGELTNPDAAHNVTHADAVAPTCTEFGNVEYWYCSDCGAAWLDEACTVFTNLMSVKLPNVHEISRFEGVEDVNGLVAVYKCACGDVDENRPVVTFKGGSIRYLLADGTEAPVNAVSIRFGYQIDSNVLAWVEANNETMTWGWAWSAGSRSGTTEGTYITPDGITNWVFTNIGPANFAKNINVTLTITITIDGEEYTFVDATQTRTVEQVLAGTAQFDDNAGARAYAQKVLYNYDADKYVAYAPSKKED